MHRSIVMIAAGLCLSGRMPAQKTDGDLRLTFEALYARIDAAVARHDKAELERLIAPDAQAVAGPVHIALRTWVGAPMMVSGASRRSEITAVRLEATEAVIAVDVHLTVAAGAAKEEGVTSSHDRWVRTEEGWLCKESVDAGGESKTPLTAPEAAKPVIAELKTRAVKVAVEPVAADDDLEAFGKAVGDARIVALGEATHGTREFFQMKQRLVQYLVRRKGFTVLALESNWPDALSVDRYIKGSGKPLDMSRIDELRRLMEWMQRILIAFGGSLPL